jgi:hypothetical protein
VEARFARASEAQGARDYLLLWGLIGIRNAARWVVLLALAAAHHVIAQADNQSLPAEHGGTANSRSSLAPAPKWRLVEEKKFFLHDPPNSFTGLYRTQGIATDGHRWFFSWQYGLEIADDDFVSVQRNSSFQLPDTVSPGIPPSLLSQGLDHIGDIDYFDGIIYASLDTTHGYTNGHVALYDARDLKYTGTVFDLQGAPSNPKNDVASWVAIDAKRGVGYGKEWQRGDTINVYHLEDWKFDHTLTLDMALERIQGGKVHGDWLYMSSDNATHSVYRANLNSGHVEELFRLPAAPGSTEVEGIALRGVRGAGRDDDAVDIYVEMIADPDRSGQDPRNTHVHASVFHYRGRPSER